MNYLQNLLPRNLYQTGSGIFFILLLNSCYSYKVTNKEFRHLKNKDVKTTVYVLNDTLQKEYKILEKSNLFVITKDSLKADSKIKLYPLRRYPGCGNPLMAQVITLGQLPVSLRKNYEYQFDQIENEKVTSQKFNLAVTQRYWFWDMFTFSRNFEKKAAKSLLGEYKSNSK